MSDITIPTNVVYVLHWFVTVLICSAFVSSLAIRNTPDIKEPPIIAIARNIRLGGWLIFGLRCLFLMFTNGFLWAQPVTLIAMAMLALGTCIACFTRLLAERGNGFKPCDECPYRHSSFPMTLQHADGREVKDDH